MIKQDLIVVPVSYNEQDCRKLNNKEIIEDLLGELRVKLQEEFKMKPKFTNATLILNSIFEE